VEDIVPTVVPIGEGGVIRACLLGGLGRSSNFLLFHLGLFTPLSLELSFVCCSQVHLVRVEGLLVAFDLSLGKFLCVVLTVVGEEGLRVGVADESVSAASLSRSLVTGWQGLDCYRNIEVRLLRGTYREFAARSTEWVRLFRGRPHHCILRIVCSAHASQCS
jgi:hypothetical protein